MARSNGISYGRLIVKNIHTVNNVSTCSQKRKFVDTTTCFRMIPRSFCNLSGDQEIPPPPPPPSSSHWSSNWGKWTAGIGVTMVIPFLQLKEDVDMVMETAEEIIDVVEVVAEAVDMVAEKIADDLLEGSNLKTTVELVEDMAEAVAGKAQKAVEFIDEIQQAEQKLNPIIEPVKQLTQSVPSGTS